jgi:pimeloyl-ACP methyl ester carboxylesterase
MCPAGEGHCGASAALAAGKSLVVRVGYLGGRFAMGRHDLMAPPTVTMQYFSHLEAPKKEWIWFEKSARFPYWEEAEQFHALLRRVLIDSVD